MAKYADETQAAADGFRIEHEPEASRYAVYLGEGSAAALVGEAHYSLRGGDVIDFDHTVITPALRGTGLSGLLAKHALTGDAARDKRIEASCWFIAEYLTRHPELAN